MKLYEINDAIETLLNALTVDAETGEVPVSADEIIEQLDALSMERTKVLEYLAKKVLNIRADMYAISHEIERLEERRDDCKIHIDSIMRVLDRECHGEKTDLGVATVQYRSSEVTEVPDEDAAVKWLMDSDYQDLVRIQRKVSVDKTGVKKLIASGVAVPGVVVTKRQNCSLK